VRLQVSAVDDQPVGLARLTGEGGEDTAEHAHAAPANEAVVEGLVGAVAGRGIAPAQAALDDEDDAAEHAAVVHARDAVREREVRPDAPHLRRGQQERDGHGSTSGPFRITPNRVAASRLMGPEPRNYSDKSW
jgi:hypothetical protein